MRQEQQQVVWPKARTYRDLQHDEQICRSSSSASGCRRSASSRSSEIASSCSGSESGRGSKSKSSGKRSTSRAANSAKGRTRLRVLAKTEHHGDNSKLSDHPSQQNKQQHGKRGSKLRAMGDAKTQARLLVQRQQQKQMQFQDIHTQQRLLQQQHLQQQTAEKNLQERRDMLQQQELSLQSQLQKHQQNISLQQNYRCRTAAAAGDVAVLKQQLQLLRVQLKHNFRDAAMWMEDSLFGFKSLCDIQASLGVGTAAARAVEAGEHQVQKLQQHISDLQLQLRQASEAQQQQVALVETLQKQQQEQCNTAAAAATAAAEHLEERLQQQKQLLQQQHQHQLQELQLSGRKQLQEAENKHERQLQQLKQQLEEAHQTVETLKLQREEERTATERHQEDSAAELRQLKEGSIVLQQQVQQQKHELQSQRQLLQQAEKDLQQQREQQQEQEQKMHEAIEQLNAAATHKENKLQKLLKERDADRLQLERERQMVMLQKEQLEEARKRLATTMVQQQQQQQAMHEQQQQLMRLQCKQQQQEEDANAMAQQLQQLQQHNDAAERGFEEKYAALKAESSQRLQQVLQQEQLLRREVAAQREMIRKGSSSSDELLLAKHELATLKHELQELLAEEAGKRDALEQQNKQQEEQLTIKQQLLRCLMQEKAALEAQVSQQQQEQQEQQQQHDEACKQHLAQTLQLQQQREAEHQKAEQLQHKLEQQQQQLLLQQQKLDILNRQNGEKQQQMLMIQREEAGLRDRLESETAAAAKLRVTLAAAQQTVQQQRQQLLLLQQAHMRGGERLDAQLLEQTDPEKSLEGAAAVHSKCASTTAGATARDGLPAATSICPEGSVSTDASKELATTKSVDGKEKINPKSLATSLLQKLSLELLLPTHAKKQSRLSSAETCDTDLHAGGSSSSNSLPGVQEQRLGSNTNSVRSSSAGSSKSNSSKSECGSSYSFRQRVKLKTCEQSSTSSNSSAEDQQHQEQPGDTPRFGPAAQLIQRVTRSVSVAGDRQQHHETATDKGSSYFMQRQQERSDIRNSIFATRKRLRQLQQQQQEVQQERRNIERQQQQRMERKAEVFELLAQQSCCCEIAYHDLLQQNTRFSVAVRNSRKLEAATAAFDASGDPAAAAAEGMAVGTAAPGDDSYGHTATSTSAAGAYQEEALRMLLAAADRNKVRAAMQHWTQEASIAKWILRIAHAERDEAARNRQKAQQMLQQLRQQTEAAGQRLLQLHRELNHLQFEERQCKGQLSELASREKQMVLRECSSSSGSSSSRGGSIGPLFLSARTLDAGRSSSSGKRCGENRSASAEPLCSSRNGRNTLCDTPPPYSYAAVDSLSSSRSSKDRSMRALGSLEALLQQHNMLPALPLKQRRPGTAAEAATEELGSGSLSSKACSFWIDLQEGASV
ncbi:centrosome-associated protein CEP250 [Cyclospora cayetanensis]|uniref:Centrosome-associated protein CEP250 n=1 Tax=Cyclospora cayetanensis TaxID=88456 RepID=A0A6P6S172_9EIME|nr:centrosome-associated protein CEP250 [Cyclospora cayetanensis]